jgi:hypothetical protein
MLSAVLDGLEFCAFYVGVDCFLTLIFGPSAAACTGVLSCIRPKAAQAAIELIIHQKSKIPSLLLVIFAALAPWNDPIPLPIWARACLSIALSLCILVRRL